jgi:purine-binding chemotaxis protein CheW
MEAPRRAISWEQAYVSLEQIRQALEAGGERSPETVKQILEDRAQALARPLDSAPTATAALDLLVFSLAGERYGIETEHVLETMSLRELTPVPCTPPLILGVMNHRGRILPILDLRRLLELQGQGVPPGGRVVAVEAGGMTFGILAEALVGTTHVAAHDVAPPPVSLTGDRQALCKGVTGTMVAVLDVEALAQDPRIMVNNGGS